MHREITVKPLTGLLLRKAYPLAQALGLRDLATWRAFAERFNVKQGDHAPHHAGDAGGILAESLRGYVCGLLFYQVNRRGKDGASLVCDPFLVTDVPRYQASVGALLEASDRIAMECGCKWVRVVLPASCAPLGVDATGCEGALFRAGYALESLSFRRRRALPPGPSLDK